MRVYILRHGEAESVKPGHADAQRQLTAEGSGAVRRVAQAARSAGARPALILVSPYQRALETAELAASELGGVAMLPVDQLGPAGHPRLVWEELRLHEAEPELLLASHEPLCGDLASYLVGCAVRCFRFSTASLACIELHRLSGEPAGVLRWLISPEVVR